jgi:hypothetical protein
MSSQTISNIMSVSIMNAVNAKVNTYINEFTSRLCSKYSLEEQDVLAMWGEVMPETNIKQSSDKPKSKDVKEKKVCKHVPTAGKNKGVECGKRCLGEFCSAHKPEKLEKVKAKRAAQKPASDEENTNELKQVMSSFNILEWHTMMTEFSKYQVIKSSMNKIDLENLINQKINSGDDVPDDLEQDVFPFVFYIKDKSLYVSYIIYDGEEEDNVHVKLPNKTLSPDLKALVNVMKKL